MRKPRVWVLPGMGADSRIFRDISFPWPATYLEWILPEEGEPLNQYADRLLAPHKIDTNDLLFGYSFGGIIAQDWASRNKVQRVVLLNSLHHSVDVRPQYRRMAATGILNWTPDHSIRRLIFFMARLNSRPTRGLDLVLEMMEQFPPEYYHWVLQSVLDWKHPEPLCPVDTIGGSLDLVFPELPKAPNRGYTLEHATHLSFLTHSKEISALLKEAVDPTLHYE